MRPEPLKDKGINMRKKEAVDTFIHMLKVYNRINKTTLTKMTHSALKNFNDAHPDIALNNRQKISISKRVAGLIYNDLMHNAKQKNDTNNCKGK